MEFLRTEIRADKRELIKKAKRKAEFAKKLTPLQQEYIDEIVDAGKEHVRVKCISVFDSTVQAALIEMTDLSYMDICSIVYKCGELMKEGFDALENISFEERIMTIKNIENEVAGKIADMIFNGMKRVDIVRAIKAEYKGSGLTTQDINIYYKKGQEAFEKYMVGEAPAKANEIKEAIKENEVDRAVDYILSEKKSDNIVKPKTANNLKGKKSSKVVICDELKSDEIKETESKFTVNNKVVKVISCDVTGSQAEYRIENGVVVIKDNNQAFANIPAVKNWASDKREELLKEIEKLNSLENETIEVIKEFI